MFWFIVILRYNKNSSRKTKIVIYSGEMNMDKDPFKEYLRESEPNKATKGYVWSTAVGLQAVDGLKPSQYLIDTAIQNIEGKITLKEAQSLIESYYNERPVRVSDNERTEEADKVSSRIAELLSETAFSFSPNEYIAIHRKLFRGIYKHAGKIRDYNITKKEWVLDGATVVYGSASELRATLEYDFSQEKDFSYKGLSIDEIIHHLAVFVSRLWQIHILERAIQGRRQYSLSSISERLVSPQPMIFSQKMRGILEMHWFVPIILTCKKAFTKLRNILKCSLEIYL